VFADGIWRLLSTLRPTRITASVYSWVWIRGRSSFTSSTSSAAAGARPGSRTRSRRPRAGMARRHESESPRTPDKLENSRPTISLVSCGVIQLAPSARRATRRTAPIHLPHNASTDSSRWSRAIGITPLSTNCAPFPTAFMTTRSTLPRPRFVPSFVVLVGTRDSGTAGAPHHRILNVPIISTFS